MLARKVAIELSLEENICFIIANHLAPNYKYPLSRCISENNIDSRSGGNDADTSKR